MVMRRPEHKKGAPGEVRRRSSNASADWLIITRLLARVWFLLFLFIFVAVFGRLLEFFD
jgi:hypothetical protein